jgi:uncharacterized membrane protein
MVHSTTTNLKRSCNAVATIAKRQVHLGLHVEEDGPPIRAISRNDGKSYYIPRTALNHCAQIRLLFEGAANDVRQRRVFSPYNSDRVLGYFDGVIGLVSVFLYEELRWDTTVNFRQNPKPVLLCLLCFFHIMVYWLNTHHILKFAKGNTFSLPQIWCLMLFSLGLVVYPLSLAAWIEKDQKDRYYIVNLAMCFFMTIFAWLTPLDLGRANCMYRLYSYAGPAFATVFYGVATMLNTMNVRGSEILLYVAPFCFMIPLGAEYSQGYEYAEATKLSDILQGALQDLQKGNVFSWYPVDRVLDYFDGVVGLATVFMFVSNSWENTIGDVNTSSDILTGGLTAALLCYFHVMAYWLNIHHMLKFSPSKISVLQVWFVVVLSLGMIAYPLCITAWVEQGSVEIYYVINLILVGFVSVFSFLTQIELGESNALYRLYHKLGPLVALVWYVLAYSLYKAESEQRWMIIAAPFLFMAPFGGEQLQELDISDNADHGILSLCNHEPNNTRSNEDEDAFLENSSVHNYAINKSDIPTVRLAGNGDDNFSDNQVNSLTFHA